MPPGRAGFVAVLQPVPGDFETQLMVETSGLWDVSADEYHADTEWVSHSALEVFRRSSALYHARYVAKTIQDHEPTPAMVIGSAVHCAVLEPQEYQNRFVQKPELDRRTKAGKDGYSLFQKSLNGQMILSQEDNSTMAAMSSAILNHPLASKLLAAPGRVEQSIRWTDAATGIQCKARFDKILDVGIALDIKTTSDPRPEEWARSANNYGYHRQSAFYRRVRFVVLNIDTAEPFLHVVVSKEPPHEVAVYELDYSAWQLGHSQIDEMLYDLARCRETDSWDNKWQIGVSSISLPKWAFMERV